MWLFSLVSYREISKFVRKLFVCHDGEGITTCGKEYCSERTEKIDGKEKRIQYHKQGCHVYALLMNDSGKQEPLIQPSGISTRDALFYLTESARLMGKDAIHVIYGGSYDANMLLQDFSYADMVALLEGYTVKFENYEVRYQARKRFDIWRYPVNYKERWKLQTRGKN